MKDENRDRMGDKFEREMSDLFQRIGFIVKNHVFTKKEDGRKSEQDVLATKGNLKILIQCKDYAKFPFENIEEVLEDLIEDGKSLEADKLILAITGYKNLSEDYVRKLKRKGIYLWNEDYWRKLQKLDLIDLYEELGKNLEIKEILKRIKDEEEQKLNSLYGKIEDIEDRNKRKLIFEQLEKLNFSDYTKREIQLKKIENQIILEKEKEINYEQIKKENTIREKEILEELKKEEILEKEELEGTFSELKILSPERREIVLDKLEELELISDIQKKRIQFEKIKNKIFSEKEKEANEEAESKIEDIELEELFSKINDSNLDFNKRYLILDKIRGDIELSKKSGKLIDFEKIKTYIEKQEESSSVEEWGDKKLDDLEELRKSGKIPFKEYIKLKEKVRQIGVSKSGISNSERKNFDYELNKAIFLKKIKKILIAIGIWGIATLILWRILF